MTGKQEFLITQGKNRPGSLSGMMPVPDAPETCRVEAPVGAQAGRSSRPRAPAVPDPHRNKKVHVPVTEVLNPRDFVCIQALPDLAQKAGKVLVRGRTIYRSSEPTGEQVFWENYRRRQKQLTEGYFTPPGKPYVELGEILYIEPKKLTLYSLGQLTQEPVDKDVQEKPPEEVAEVTTNNYSSSRESDLPEPSKKLIQVRETGKELRTLSKALARSRHHLSSLKRGGQYFHVLRQESLQKKNTLKAAKQAQGTRWRTELQPPEYSSDVKEDSDEEINTCSLTEGSHLRVSGKKKKKMTLQSFAALCASVLIPNPPGAKSEHLFRQLCAIHWLLEALTLESNNSMSSILTCWNPINPGGRKKTVREIKEEKLATLMQELFVTNRKKSTWKAQYSVFRRKVLQTSALGIPQLSHQSSLHGQTPRGSITSTVPCSEDNIKISVSSSNVTSESEQAKEQPLFPSLQKGTKKTDEEASKDVHGQEVKVKKTGLQLLLPVAQENHRVNMPFIKDRERTIARKQRPRSCHISSLIKSKSNLRDNMRQKFAAVHEAAACRLHDTLESLERVLLLLARLPESVKSDHYVQKISKKLEKYGKNPDLKIPPDTFVKVLADLPVWELCSPEIAAAVEFVRENIVQMPEEDFSEWLQTRVTPLCAQSSTF
ncbi:coiled-coil domain-containing protein 60 isoform X2 [Cuculus canorus]|uniref:coiled-coil domain-containing protein 60 isoform X2 n=1 Tax=Cuculus canorus TaxID=55661 RepID=UPI0023AAC75B|nr:coiled-coil domain-containing protein 60 isoform X2 [Cuculus canorus]